MREVVGYLQARLALTHRQILETLVEAIRGVRVGHRTATV